MGCYNEVHVPCPKCHATYETQSKGGTCNYEKYTLQTAPIGDLAYMVGEVFTCQKCGIEFEFHAVCLANTIVHIKIPEDD